MWSAGGGSSGAVGGSGEGGLGGKRGSGEVAVVGMWKCEIDASEYSTVMLTILYL